jgi:hypothetical protein
MGNNSIHTSDDHHVVNFSPSITIAAEGNYWGTAGPKASKFSGAVDYSPYICSDPIPSSSIREIVPPDVDPGPAAPRTFALFAAHPNPFNPTTTMRYDVPRVGVNVNITIYDVSGARVRVLVDGLPTVGVHNATWNGQDDRGRPVASGVYFVKMEAATFAKTRKLVLLK